MIWDCITFLWRHHNVRFWYPGWRIWTNCREMTYNAYMCVRVFRKIDSARTKLIRNKQFSQLQIKFLRWYLYTVENCKSTTIYHKPSSILIHTDFHHVDEGAVTVISLLSPATKKYLKTSSAPHWYCGNIYSSYPDFVLYWWTDNAKVSTNVE